MAAITVSEPSAKRAQRTLNAGATAPGPTGHVIAKLAVSQFLQLTWTAREGASVY